MKRREFLALTAGAGLASGADAVQELRPMPATSLIRPKVLRPGDTVGLITPATFVSDPDRFQLAEHTLRWFGLKWKYGRNVRKRSGYLGGSVEERLEDLHSMFADPEVRAIFAIRGGYGSAQLLDHIDYGLIRRNPKIFVGFSDITALHLAIGRQTGLVTFHGPTALSSFTEYTERFFRKALFDPAPLGRLTNPDEGNVLRPRHWLRTIRSGQASGPLIGGNLSLICSLMGTPFEIDTTGKILFLEDVAEEPYRIDRMLTQLRLAGKLEAAAGIVIGECADCTPREYRPSFTSTFTIGEILDEFFSNAKCPILYGLTLGHTPDQLTLPLGVRATLNADEGVLIVEEPAAEL